MKKMKRKINMVKTIACAMIGLLLFAQPMAGGAQRSGEAATDVMPPLKIGPGDLLDVTMFENADLSGRFRVDQQGDITIPLLGRVHVQGETAEAAAVLIEKRYVDAQILQPAESHATVFIAEYATQGITVSGEVKAPGVYPALGVRMLNDVITAAGGITVAASSDVVISHRNDPGNPVSVYYNPTTLRPVIPQTQIFPGDTVMIPRAGIVYVLGDVGHSGAYVLDGRKALTVEEAMALAGGGGRAAALKSVQLVRTLEDGRKEAITVPVNLIYKNRAPDVALKDGDILFVPTSTGKLAAEQAISAALSIGTSIAVYRTSVQ
jgi:polysaccharide export outer membrane protein